LPGHPRLELFEDIFEEYGPVLENVGAHHRNLEGGDENHGTARENYEVGVEIMGIVINLELTVARTNESGIRDVGTY